MKPILLVAALAVMAAPAAWAGGCTDDPKASIKQVEQALKKQNAKLPKEKKRKAAMAIDRAKMANKFGNAAGTCKSLEEARAVLGLKE